MHLSAISVFISIVLLAQIFIGLMVLIDGLRHKKLNSKLFFLVVLSSSAWTVANLPLINATGINVSLPVSILNVFNKTGFTLAIAALLTMSIFVSHYPERREVRAIDKLLYLFAGILAVGTSTNVVSGYFTELDRQTSYYPGKLSFLLIIYVLLVVTNILYKLRTTNDKVKTQVQYVRLGLVLTILHALILIIVIPIFIGEIDIVYALGYMAPIYFLGFTLASLLRHSFLDIRSVIARSAAYLFTIFILSGVYFLMAVVIGDALLSLGLPKNFEKIVYLIFTVILAILFTPLRTLFDKLTNKIFYRDAYDTQVILDQVSGVIVGNVDPHKVQRGALKALSEALRPTYMIFLLAHGSDKLHEGDLVGQQWNTHNPEVLHEALRRVGKKIVIYDELEERSTKLRDVLRVEDISVAAPLVTKDEHIGYLILGPKKSGNIYNSQDVGLLNIASNELAVALQNAQRFEEIQAFNITLQEKVTEATRELKKTNRKLIALDEAKDEFISMASHQLRTPLTSIKGYISMMMEGDLGKLTAQQENALKEAFGSSQRMVYLIADFLNVSRIKTGKFVIEPKEVDLPMVVSEEITQLREMAGSRDITLQYQAPEVFPKVMLDDNKIRQVMMNIVDNAIYYTAAGGTVTIQLFVDSADVVFKVIDTGIGVPKREQHKLFTKFFRAGNARKARPDGTGLGLFMAQKIIAEQGGSIIFESTEGKGSTFGFRFPLSKIKT